MIRYRYYTKCCSAHAVTLSLLVWACRLSLLLHLSLKMIALQSGNLLLTHLQFMLILIRQLVSELFTVYVHV